jgi:hypothetical protein
MNNFARFPDHRLNLFRRKIERGPLLPPWARHCLLAAAMICVCVPRLWDLGHPSFTYDELSDYEDSVRFSSHPSVLSPVSEGYLNGELPYFCAAGLYRLVGRSEAAARLQSVIGSILSVLLVFLIVKRLCGFGYGILALLLLGLSPFYLSASRLAFSHGHVLSTLPLLAMLWFLQRVHGDIASNRVSKADLWPTAAMGIFAGLALGSDLLAGFAAFSVLALLCIHALRSKERIHLALAASFAAGCLMGLLVASPTYVTAFPHSLRDAIWRIRVADGKSGYLWLGHVVRSIPIYYYLVVLATRLTPVVLVVSLATLALVVRRPSSLHAFSRLLLIFLWPLLYLSVKPWKNPYYLTPFIPLLFMLLADGIRILFSTRVFRERRYLAVIVVVAVLVDQAYAIIRLHPDYLMQGIEYSGRLYGEFQGPAVSHGQWIGEALSYVRQDCQDREPVVYAVSDVGTPQIRHYAEEYGVAVRIGEVPPADTERDNAYVLISRDARQMICPDHKTAITRNATLVAFADHSAEYALVRTYYSARFPMLWIYGKAARARAPSDGGSIWTGR